MEQVKRIHEYKRQVLNVLGVIHRHSELRRMRREAPGLLGAVLPRAVILSGKAAPGYAMAKLVIKLIMHVAAVVNADKDTNSLLKVVFIPNYNVKMAETIIPAADVSQHLSTAGMEASGTGNIKFAINGCLLLASLDGATAEICHEVGEENLFIFGTRAHEVSAVRDKLKRGDAKVDARYLKALHRIREGDFGAADAFEPLLEALRPENDDYLVGADFGSYLEAQAKVPCLRPLPPCAPAWSSLASPRVLPCTRACPLTHANLRAWHPLRPFVVPSRFVKDAC